MKKYVPLCVLILTLLLPSLSLAQMSDVDTSGDSTCATISVNLRYLARDASTSGAVSILQDFLSSRGYLNIQPTGFFGSMTRAAVVSFQKDNGISATPPGFVGSVTRARIQAIDCNNAPTTQPVTQQTIPVPSPVPTPAPIATCTINSFTTFLSTITAGMSSPLSWSTTNCTSVYMTTAGISERANYSSIGNVSVNPTITTTYILTASGANNVATSRSATITVNPAPQSPNIRLIESGSNPVAVISINQKASIHGTGLSGNITVKIEDEIIQTVSAYGMSDTYAEFTVPARLKSSMSTVSVTNASGKISNTYGVTITVPTTPAPIATCTINSFTTFLSTITAGMSSPLSWSTTNCTSVYMTTAGISERANYSSIGNVSVNPTITTTYILTASGANNVATSRSATITVNPAPQSPTITSVESPANPLATITANQKAYIRGTGLSGNLTVIMGVQEIITVPGYGITDTYAEFLVPFQSHSSMSTISVTNASGKTSNYYGVNYLSPFQNQ